MRFGAWPRDGPGRAVLHSASRTRPHRPLGTPSAPGDLTARHRAVQPSEPTAPGVANSPRRRSRRRSLAVKQVANARKRVLDIRRVSLEVRLNTAQEVGERSRIKPLHPVRIFTRFSFCPLNRRLELVLARLRGSCRLLKLPLENS